MSSTRLEGLLSQAREASLDAVLLIPGPNFRYFCGVDFHLSERPTVALFPMEGKPVVVVPALEEHKASTMDIPFEVFTYTDEEGPQTAFESLRAAVDLSGRTLGVEGRRCRFLELNLLDPQIRVVNGDPVFAELRSRKDAREVAAMERAVAIAEGALAQTLPLIRAGVTENEIVSELTLQLYRGGSGPELPFHPFAVTGANGALPHASPGDRSLEPGDFLTIDWGANHDGYMSDITRTFVVQGADPDARLTGAYDAVLAGNTAARECARPGVTAGEVDAAARQVIEAAGFGEFFTHRTGHGLGLECHEEPDIVGGSELVLAEGMTFTIEPGVYIPGLGGMRVEDDVLITTDGSRSLTNLDRTLQTVG